MNTGLMRAKEAIVLFLDDDVIPDENLVAAHVQAHEEAGVAVVAGRVVQPWDREGVGDTSSQFRFSSLERQWVHEFVGCNFSVKRTVGLRIGGFDENFIDVAYRFEADFAERILAEGGRILFEPAASVFHLKAWDGGTRAYGDHLKTAWPSHAVGEYYYLLRRWRSPRGLRRLAGRPIRAIKTRHHLRQPWWIPATLTAELLGLCWGLMLAVRGPRYLQRA
jgi:GT2 family glycosyltransferase